MGFREQLQEPPMVSHFPFNQSSGNPIPLIFNHSLLGDWHIWDHIHWLCFFQTDGMSISHPAMGRTSISSGASSMVSISGRSETPCGRTNIRPMSPGGVRHLRRRALGQLTWYMSYLVIPPSRNPLMMVGYFYIVLYTYKVHHIIVL